RNRLGLDHAGAEIGVPISTGVEGVPAAVRVDQIDTAGDGSDAVNDSGQLFTAGIRMAGVEAEPGPELANRIPEPRQAVEPAGRPGRTGRPGRPRLARRLMDRWNRRAPRLLAWCRAYDHPRTSSGADIPTWNVRRDGAHAVAWSPLPRRRDRRGRLLSRTVRGRPSP